MHFSVSFGWVLRFLSSVSAKVTINVWTVYQRSSNCFHRARCTGVAACQSWAEHSSSMSRPTTDSRHQGWAIKDFFVLSEMLTICEQSLYSIVVIILYRQKYGIFLISSIFLHFCGVCRVFLYFKYIHKNRFYFGGSSLALNSKMKHKG